MILPHQEILRLCGFNQTDPDTKETSTGLIRPCLKRNVRSAGYNLRLGKDYYLPSSKEVGEDGFGGLLAIDTIDLSKASTISIPPNQVIIVSMNEQLKLPPNMVGHLSLKLDLLLKGLIMASQSQIDAGYSGNIFALLYNLSNDEVYISHGEPILRLELATLSEDTTLPYKGDFMDKPLAASLQHRINSGLFKIRQDVNSAKRDLTRTQLVAIVLAAILGIAPAVFSYFGVFEGRVNKVEATIEAQEKQGELELKNLEVQRTASEKALQAQIDALKKEVEELKRR
jgi:deoxycytidine triphosphate deaminase